MDSLVENNNAPMTQFPENDHYGNFQKWMDSKYSDTTAQDEPVADPGGNYPGVQFESITEIAERLLGKQPVPTTPTAKNSLRSDRMTDKKEPTTIEVAGLPLSSIGLLIPDDLRMDFARYQKTVDAVWVADQGRAWAAGDLLIYGERYLDGIYENAFDAFKYVPETLENKRWLCRRFPRENRYSTLTFSHHAIVAPYNDEVAYTLLGIAAERQLTTRQLKELRKEYDRLNKAGHLDGADNSEGESGDSEDTPRPITILASLPLRPSDFTNRDELRYTLPSEIADKVYAALYDRPDGSVRLIIEES